MAREFHNVLAIFFQLHDSFCFGIVSFVVYKCDICGFNVSFMHVFTR